MSQNHPMDDELTPEELEQARRRRIIRSVIVIVVVVAMMATLLFPVIVRIVQTPRTRDIVIAIHAGDSWHRMVP